MSKNQVPEYSEIKLYQSKVREVKRDYIRHLISLGYILEKRGMYESTTYWAIHKDYYKIPEERIWSDDFDGTVTPDYFPTGAFIVINTLAESETEDPWETDYLLEENMCFIRYLQ